MALLNTELSLWEIAFRWAGLDPDRIWLRLPLGARDNFRTLMHAILHGHLDCESLSLEKYYGDDRDEASLYIRYWLDGVHACIDGKKFDRQLLKHALIDRSDLREWCNRRGAPLPDFWFPSGWSVDYKWPSDDNEEGSGQSGANSLDVEDKASAKGLRPHQRTRIAAQQIASAIWKNDPTRTIASICKDELILKYGGGAHYEEETVKGWIRAVAPPEVSNKRGRPPKKTPADDERG